MLELIADVPAFCGSFQDSKAKDEGAGSSQPGLSQDSSSAMQVDEVSAFLVDDDEEVKTHVPAQVEQAHQL